MTRSKTHSMTQSIDVAEDINDRKKQSITEFVRGSIKGSSFTKDESGRALTTKETEELESAYNPKEAA